MKDLFILGELLPRVEICPYGLAIVDTPKGDLDASGSIESTDDSMMIVNDAVFMYGTTEQYPAMEDSDLQVLDESAHGYMECSNVGECDRKTGQCYCYEGFEGTACQRQSCPGEPMCSGRGVCQSAHEAAKRNSHGVYTLWDRKISSGCLCDPEYFGPDCSMRRCPIGVDPLYMDDVNSYRIATIYFAIMTTSNSPDFTDGIPQSRPGTGKWAIRFYDQYGQPFLTEGIPPGASCSQIIAALEALPHNIVPVGQSVCMKAYEISRYPLDAFRQPLKKSEWTYTYWSRYRFYFSGPRLDYETVQPTFWSAGYTNSFNAPNQTGHDDTMTGDIYRIQFLGNPGQIIQPEIELYLDGNRPSLVSSGKLSVATWSDGQQGETIDYFTEFCHKVLVRVVKTAFQGEYFLRINPPQNEIYLKACLSSSDTEINNNLRTVDWDMGSRLNPHAVKLKRAHTDHLDGGYFALIFFDPSFLAGGADGTFRLLHPFVSLDNDTSADFYVFSSEGTAMVAGNQTSVSFDFASRTLYATNITYDTSGKPNDGDVDCETMNGVTDTNTCLKRGDKFFLIDPFSNFHNPPFLNLYTVMGLYKQKFDFTYEMVYPNAGTKAQQDSHYFKNVIVTDVATNWAAESLGAAKFMIIKFTPSEMTTSVVVSECSNRGACNTFEGICDCFSGYTGGDCSEQTTLQI